MRRQLMADSSTAGSFKDAEAFLTQLHPALLVGRTCLVATHGSRHVSLPPSRLAIDSTAHHRPATLGALLVPVCAGGSVHLHCGVSEEMLAGQYDVPLLYYRPQTEPAHVVAARVLRGVTLACGHCRHAAATLPAALVSDVVNPTTL
jgi:hypothetical protein